MLGAPAIAQGPDAWPARPIRWIVPYTPGAGADAVARMLAEKLSLELGQPVVVENRGGAAGMIGTDFGAKSPPDGYTWIMGSDAGFTIAPNLNKAPYDPLKDFTPVSIQTTVPMMLVAGANFPHATIAELPGVPTIAESGYPDFHIGVWHGLLMPAGVPQSVVSRTNQAVAKVLTLPDIVERLNGLSFIAGGGRPQDLSDLIAREHAQWRRLIQAARIGSG